MRPVRTDMAAPSGPKLQTVAGRGRVTRPPNARVPDFITASHADVDAVIGKLAAAHIGIGAVGRQAAIQLARIGVARQFMVDPGYFKPESLLTQPIGPAEVGQPKARNAAELCKSLSPATQAQFYRGPLGDLDPVDFEGIDLLIVATDNLLAEVHAAQIAAHLGKPLIHAAVHGESLTVQVRVFSFASFASPCPVCTYGPLDWKRLNSETRFSCESATDGRAFASTASQPTMSVSALCSLAGELAIIQLIRFVAGMGKPVCNTVLEYNGYTHRTVISPLVRNPQCPVDHVPWVRASASAFLPDCTPATLIQEAGFEPDGRTTFLVRDMQFVALGVCERGHEQRIGRFVPLPSGAIERCRDCRAPIQPHPHYAYHAAPEKLLEPHLNRSLGSLCNGLPLWVVVQQGERAVLFSAEST